LRESGAFACEREETRENPSNRLLQKELAAECMRKRKEAAWQDDKAEIEKVNAILRRANEERKANEERERRQR
jgi:hypothetical protein